MGHMLCDDLAVQREGLTKAAKYWPQGRTLPVAGLSRSVRQFVYGTMKLNTLVR